MHSAGPELQTALAYMAEVGLASEIGEFISRTGYWAKSPLLQLTDVHPSAFWKSAGLVLCL